MVHPAGTKPLTKDSDLPEEELICRFRSGDGEALCALFDRHEGLLRQRIDRLLPPYLRRRQSISDVLQESRIVAFERREDFEPRRDGSLRNWLLEIVERKARRAVQWHAAVEKRSARREVTKAHRAETAQFAGDGPSPSEVAIASELEVLARRAMETLPQDYQDVLRLSWKEQLNLREISLRRERSYEATKKLYGRALARFGKALRALRGESRG
ncbi:MAG: RNA polymerase sigma factor [Planctomycetota bacterium]|jgi:RNA polymerase sigma factor (sigma-70 family)